MVRLLSQQQYLRQNWLPGGYRTCWGVWMNNFSSPGVLQCTEVRRSKDNFKFTHTDIALYSNAYVWIKEIVKEKPQLRIFLGVVHIENPTGCTLNTYGKIANWFFSVIKGNDGEQHP